MSAVYSEEERRKVSAMARMPERTGKKWNAIPGLCYLDSNGQYRTTA